jgi:hypothetical protein
MMQMSIMMKAPRIMLEPPRIMVKAPRIMLKAPRVTLTAYTQQNRDSYFKKKNTCFKQKIA